MAAARAASARVASPALRSALSWLWQSVHIQSPCEIDVKYHILNPKQVTGLQAKVIFLTAIPHDFAKGLERRAGQARLLWSALAHKGCCAIAVSGSLLLLLLRRNRKKEAVEASTSMGHGQIDPGEIVICKRADGSDWLLGQGSFGKVRPSMTTFPLCAKVEAVGAAGVLAV